MIDSVQWRQLRGVANAAFGSSMHLSIASVGVDGAPYVTPVGSVLFAEPGRLFYFEFYAVGLGQRLANDPRVSVLAVNSSKRFWLAGLLRSRFSAAPAVRLVGVASRHTRPATAREQALWWRRVRLARLLPGGRRLWRVDSPVVRDLWIDRIDRVGLGGITAA